MREHAALAVAENEDRPVGPRTRLFFQVLLPLGILANLALGLIILAGLDPARWTQWLQIGTGAFCCFVAGWLSAALWSKVYWNRSMARQVAVWRRIADAFFAWIEDAQLPADALRRLQTSLDKAVPSSERNHEVF